MMLPYADWLPHQRWYAGRGRTIAAVVDTCTPLAADLDHVLLDVQYEDGAVDTYQLVVGWDRVPVDEYAGVARIGDEGGRTAYDALYDDVSAREILAMIARGQVAGRIRFRPEPGTELPVDAISRIVSSEQTNTSVVFDTAAILKLFRRVTPGMNPDLELNRALGRNHSPHVATLLGAIEGETEDGQPLSLATVTEFARNAADGWAMATGSVRALLAEPDIGAAAAGGDFAPEASRLGAAVADVHTVLGDDLGRRLALPPTEWLRGRWRRAAEVVPELAEKLPAAEAFLDRLTEPTTQQRIHGDLHLGQALRTLEQWILIDFEGEPGQSMEERQRVDSPMRDVAGMLRSFDYAAHHLQVEVVDADRATAQAEEWIARNQNAFCDGYAERSGIDPREHPDLLAAYELDKAFYEAVYETRHRPTWLPVPLRAIDRVLATSRS